MEELTLNTHGCPRFEVHAFKKGRCKNCGTPWQEHKGVISQELLDAFVLAAKQAEDERRQKEDEAQAAAKAKSPVKRRPKPAEDDWFYDSPRGDDPESDDEDRTGG